MGDKIGKRLKALSEPMVATYQTSHMDDPPIMSVLREHHSMAAQTLASRKCKMGRVWHSRTNGKREFSIGGSGRTGAVTRVLGSWHRLFFAETVEPHHLRPALALADIFFARHCFPGTALLGGCALGTGRLGIGGDGNRGHP